MANIASQIKRNDRSLREHDENRRLTSAIKTNFRRLEEAVSSGDSAAADSAHRQGRRLWRASREQRCAEEVARGPHSRRRVLLSVTAGRPRAGSPA